MLEEEEELKEEEEGEEFTCFLFQYLLWLRGGTAWGRGCVFRGAGGVLMGGRHRLRAAY